MSKIYSVSLIEFQWLVQYAQKHHANQNEPIPEFGESAHGAISSCLETPFQTFGRKHLYPGFAKKAAILFYLLCKNHPLPNGNKRMACMTLGYFFIANGYEMLVPPEQMYSLALNVTKSSPSKMEEVVRILEHMILDLIKQGSSNRTSNQAKFKELEKKNPG